MPSRPRILLIGASGYGDYYLDELTGHDAGADLVGVVDINPDVEANGVPVYQSLDDFYANHAADLAIIAAPMHFHTPMTLTCLKNGSNVLCEKPLCQSVEEVALLQKAATEAGRFLAVGYQMDYRRDVLALKEDILSGRFGAPKRLSILHCSRRGAKYYSRNNWAGRISVNGREVLDSPFNNSNAHNFQMMTFLLGDSLPSAMDIKSVEAELYHGNPTTENFDILAARFHTMGGYPLYYYTAHTLSQYEQGPLGVFEFEKGTVTFDSREPSFRAKMADGSAFDYIGIDPGHTHQKLYDAIACTCSGGAPVCSAAADLPHIRAVRMLADLPILPVREELRRHMDVDGDDILYIEGLEDIFKKCAQSWALPSEIGLGLS